MKKKITSSLIALFLIITAASAQDNKAPSDKYDQRPEKKSFVQQIKEYIHDKGIPSVYPQEPKKEYYDVINKMDAEYASPASVSPTPTVKYNQPEKKEKLPDNIGAKPGKNN